MSQGLHDFAILGVFDDGDHHLAAGENGEAARRLGWRTRTTEGNSVSGRVSAYHDRHTGIEETFCECNGCSSWIKTK